MKRPAPTNRSTTSWRPRPTSSRSSTRCARSCASKASARPRGRVRAYARTIPRAHAGGRCRTHTRALGRPRVGCLDMTADSVYIDGSSGEGGGQILRTSLALAMITGRTLHMRNIRAGRAKPGLRRQHLACVEAAARLCHAEVRGAAVSSQELFFAPGAVAGGELMIDIGTAGSTTLVVQTILVPAIAAGIALRAEIRGGTHNPLAPPFEFLERVWVPHLRAMGARVGLTLDRHGFASGGPHRGNRGERDDRAAHRTRDDRGERDERAARDDRRGERER